MKHLTNIASLLLCILFIGTAAQAQENQENKDARYLAGAVPEEDGKVVFTKEYSIPGMAQDEVFDRMRQWMDTRLKENQNDSRVLYTNKEKGQIVGTVDEWIVFSSSALALDRTRILAQLTVFCHPEACTFSVEKIRYIYREGEDKYTAEEWITDKYPLPAGRRCPERRARGSRRAARPRSRAGGLHPQAAGGHQSQEQGDRAAGQGHAQARGETR